MLYYKQNLTYAHFFTLITVFIHFQCVSTKTSDIMPFLAQCPWYGAVPISVTFTHQFPKHTTVFSQYFPSHVSHKLPSLVLLLGFDISLNSCPTRLAFVNSRSMKNKGPLISEKVETKAIDIFALAETNIRPFNAPGLIRSIIPNGFPFHQKPRDRGCCGRVLVTSPLVNWPNHQLISHLNLLWFLLHPLLYPQLL